MKKIKRKPPIPPVEKKVYSPKFKNNIKQNNGSDFTPDSHKLLKQLNKNKKKSKSPNIPISSSMAAKIKPFSTAP